MFSCLLATNSWNNEVASYRPCKGKGLSKPIDVKLLSSSVMQLLPRKLRLPHILLWQQPRRLYEPMNLPSASLTRGYLVYAYS